MTGNNEYIFYDGECGLCHTLVRYVLLFQPGEEGYRFSPLYSPAFRRLIGEPGAIPEDTVVVRTATGELLVKSEAVVHVLHSLGPINRFFGLVVKTLPRGLRDSLYDTVASIRKRLFPKANQSCPIVPPQQRSRFVEE